MSRYTTAADSILLLIHISLYLLNPLHKKSSTVCLRIYCFQLPGSVPPLFHYRGGKSTAHIQFTRHQWTTKSFGHKHLSLIFLDSASHSDWFLSFEDRCWENLEKSVAQLCVIWLLAMAGPQWVCKYVAQKKHSYWPCAVWVTSVSLAVTWCFWHCQSCFFALLAGSAQIG